MLRRVKGEVQNKAKLRNDKENGNKYALNKFCRHVIIDCVAKGNILPENVAFIRE